MKRMIIAALSIVLFGSNAYTQETRKQEALFNKALVVYFSATGTTAGVAKKIAQVSGGELYEIVPQTPYTSDDLDWRNKQSRSSLEMGNPKSRPAIKGKKEHLSDYDVIFIGYPIWWNVAPTIVRTFIESHPLKGKTVIPFATSGSSGIENSVAQLKKDYPEIQWRDGRLLNGATEQTIREWIEKELKK
ncbi:flavodoxin [Tannerella sp.]|uniref:flavodoxin n=1 Tax=Tannerella sp. TaxID=2382127 RepID=UPI003FA2E5AD